MSSAVDTGSLLERTDELEALDAALAYPAAGGRLVTLEGGAGIGKTSVVRAACRMARDARRRVLLATCAELERDFAFGVVRQLLDPATSDHPALVLGHSVTKPTTSPFEALEALFRLLARLADDGPLFVAVDDVQWCDVASLRFLGFLVRRFADLPVTVLVAGRSPEDDVHQQLLADLQFAERTRRLYPRALTNDAVGTLIRRELGRDPGAELVQACARTTEGNPLFVRELSRLLREQDEPPGVLVANVPTLGPQALVGHVQHRLARQDPAVRSVAYALSVLGTGATVPLAAGVARLPAPVASTAVRTLQRLGFIEWDPTVAYVHPLIQAAVYAGIDPGTRQELHARCAEELARGGAALERQAAHVMETQPAGDQDRVRLLLATAEQSWRRGAPDSTIAYLRRALAEPPVPSLVSEVARRLGATEAYVLDFGAAESNVRLAMATADTPPQLALVGYTLARLLESFNQVADAREVLLSVPRDPALVGSTLAARIHAELVGYARIVLAQSAEYDDRLAELRRFGGEDWHRTPSVISAMTALGRAAAGGSASEVLADAEPALRRTDLTAVMGGLYFLVHALLSVGALEPARRELVRAVAEARRQGLSVAVSAASSHLAWEAFVRGDLREVDAWLTQGRSTPVVPGNAADDLAAFTVELALERGDLEGARAALADTGPPRPVITTHCLKLQLARGRLALESGDAAQAVVELRLLESAYERWDALAILDRPWRLVLARALTVRGQPDEARRVAAEQLTLARAVGSPVHEGPALRGVAALETGEQRIALLDQAVAVLQDTSARLELAYALADLAAAQSSGQPDRRARRHLRDAHDLAVECGADGLATTTARLLRVGGGRPPPVATSGPAALTDSERRVAELAATGATNRQIARRLFVTEKTVESHLSHALRKLGLTSRRDIGPLLPTTRDHR